MVGFLFGGSTGETAQSLARKREMQDALTRQIMGNQPKNTAEGIGALLKGAAVGIGKYRADKSEKASTDAARSLFEKITGTPRAATPGAMAGNMPKVNSSGNVAPAPVGNDEIRNGILASASSLGIDPVDLATAISYETAGTFDPTKRGPTTQWGQHQGFIQFGEPQAKEHGVDWNNPVGSQLGENGAVVSYLRKAGVKPGMGVMDIYSAINAGGVGRYGASDANNGGAPGTVADKVNQQMAGHRAKALALIGEGGGQTGAAPQNAAEAVTAMAGGNAPQPSGSPFASPFVDPAMQQQGGSLSDEVAAYEQTPEYAARFPGQNVQAPAMEPPREVSALPVPPQSQPLPQGIPEQFQGSQQLANAQGGIMPALMGGTPATAQQIAQAQQVGQQPPMQVEQTVNGGVDPRLYEVLANDFTPPEMKAQARAMIQQQLSEQEAAREQQLWLHRQQYETEQKRSDPSYQLGLRKTQAELDQMGKPEYRTLTQEERQQYGIPDTDQRLYQVSRGGKVDAVGGAGQTINVGNEVEARKAAAEQVGLKPEDPAYQGFILTGKLPREDAQTLTATDKKAMWAAEDEIPMLDNTISSLEHAKTLNGKTYSGTGAGLLGTIGTNVPGAGLFLDRDKATATSEFNKLMSMEAIQSMAQTLKGATTDSELARFVDILADPSTDPSIRERTIDRMLALANRVKDVKANRVNELRGGGVQAPAGGKKSTTVGGYTIEEE